MTAAGPDVLVVLMVDTHRDDARGEQAPVSIGGLPALSALLDRCRMAGADVVNAAHDLPGASSTASLLWDYGSVASLPSGLRGRFDRVVAWSLESPLVADRAFRRLGDIAAESTAVFGFPGARDLLPATRRDRFHDLWWPASPRVGEWLPWEERGLVCMVNSNKRAHDLWPRGLRTHPYRALRTAAAGVLARSRRLAGWRVPDLYRERLRAIRHFGSTGDFDLYGVGWRDRRGLGSAAGAVAASYRGAPADKLEVMRRHRFALCLENTAFAGYVS
jgi:hypothetical protein